MKKNLLKDVTVATVMPFTPNGDIDWDSYRNLLRYCTEPDGICAVFVNGHAGESTSLTREERQDVIRFTRDFVGPNRPLVAGLAAHSTADAIAQAQDAQTAGADVLTVFPLGSFSAGGTRTPDVPLAYVRAIADAVSLPLAIFQFPVGSGASYTTETLVKLAQLPNVVAIKEGSDTIMAYEDNWRAVKGASPDVAILPSNFDWFLAQLAIGGDGILSGLASLAPHALAQLWRATQREDLRAMRAISDRLHPLVRAVYAAPRMDMYARMKVALKRLGVIDCAASRSPILPACAQTAAVMASAVAFAGITGITGKRP